MKVCHSSALLSLERMDSLVKLLAVISSYLLSCDTSSIYGGPILDPGYCFNPLPLREIFLLTFIPGDALLSLVWLMLKLASVCSIDVADRTMSFVRRLLSRLGAPCSVCWFCCVFPIFSFFSKSMAWSNVFAGNAAFDFL